jgi:thymidine kinase
MAKLYFRYGAMGSGKTIDLLKVAYNYEEKNQKVMLFASGIDDRYGVGKITTRIGLSKDAEIYKMDTNMYEFIKNYKFKPDCVLIDEANFLTKKQVNQLSDVVDYLNIPVICYGLRADFRQNFFEGSAALMEISDKIEEIKTICECGRKAIVNMRLIDGVPTTKGDKILIGGNDSYTSVCRRCYKKYIKENK